MRRFAFPLALMVLASITLAGCGGKKKDDNVLARVNKQPITKTQLYQELEQANNGETARQTLDSLIVRQLIREEARSRNIEVSQEDLNRRIEGMKDYILAMSGKDWQAWLDETGQTEEEIRERLTIQLLTTKLVLTDTDREKYFEQNNARLKDMPHNNDSVIFRQIIVATKEEAEAVRKELAGKVKEGKVSGADFAAVAKERTLDPNGRETGGIGGWVVKGKSADKSLEQVLFALNPGQVSDVLEVVPPTAQGAKTPPASQTPHFYRIVMVEKRVTPGKLTLENNADIIEEWMMSDPQYQSQFSEFIANLRAKADIQIDSPRYRSLGEAYKRGREQREQRLNALGKTGPGAPATRMPAPAAPSQGPVGK